MDNAFTLESTLCNGIKAIYEYAQMSDVILKAGGTEVHAHKVALTAHSASFKAMFQASCCARLVLFLPACLGYLSFVWLFLRTRLGVLASALCHLLLCAMESMLWLVSCCICSCQRQCMSHQILFREACAAPKQGYATTASKDMHNASAVRQA